MNRFVLADTGPLYAAVDPDDAHHRRAQSDLGRLVEEKRGVTIAYPTLLETYSLVLRRLGKKAASRWLDEVLNATSLVNPSTEEYLQAALQLGNFSDQSITLFDAVVSVLAMKLGAPVWTYDHHFDVMRSKVWRWAD